jgi:hypothetical protein
MLKRGPYVYKAKENGKKNTGKQFGPNLTMCSEN